METWIEVVPPMKKREAEEQFNQWKRENLELYNRLVSEQGIRIDVIRSAGKKVLVSYWILIDHSG